MKRYIMPALIFIATLWIMTAVESSSNDVNASIEQESIYSWCNWLHNAAETVAINRDLGMDKLDLTQNYLAQNTRYLEQKVIIDVINRAYTSHRKIAAQDFAKFERSSCDKGFRAINHRSF